MSGHRRGTACALALVLAGILALPGCWIVELPAVPPDAGLSLDIDNSDIFGAAGDLANCLSNQTYCVGKVLYRCNKKGTEWITEDCAKAGKHCTRVSKDAYACSDKICQPKSLGCADDGLNAVVCSDDGKKWIPGVDCSGAKEKRLCLEGKCVEPCSVPSKVTYQGCTFMTANLPNYESDKIGFLVYNSSKLAAKVEISDGTRGLASAQIKPGKKTTLTVDVGTNMVNGSARKKGWGFLLSSSVKVEAMQISPLGISSQVNIKQRSSDGTMLLPWSALAGQYAAIALPVSNKDDMSYIAIVGAYPGTKVTVKPTTDTLAGDGIPALKKGQTYNTTLEIKDLLVLATKTMGADITGTSVEADRRIAVFSGNTCANLPANKSHCDHVQEQLLPVGSWSTGYIAAKFKPRGKTPEKDLWRIFTEGLKAVDVTITTGNGAPFVKKIKKGEVYDFETAESFTVRPTTDRFIAVGHFSQGQAAVPMPLDKATYSEGFESLLKCPTKPSEGNLGDPSMSQLVPHTNYANSYNLLVPTNYKYDFLTVLVPSRVNKPIIVLDGKVLTKPLTRIKGTYSFYTHLRVTDGYHSISSNIPIGVEVHGYDCNTGYSYNGGMEHEQTTPF